MIAERRAVLDVIRNEVAKSGVSVTLCHVAIETGLELAEVRRHVRCLEAAGLVRRAPDAAGVLQIIDTTPRGLRPAELAWCHANADRVRAMMVAAGALA